jgi:hypothetical protein
MKQGKKREKKTKAEYARKKKRMVKEREKKIKKEVFKARRRV